jgi:hypothetical protein
MAKQDGQLDAHTILKDFKGSKRARIVVQHILEHGSINTDQLAALGYKHPPRAIRDVKDAGVPVVRTTIRTDGGRSIGQYAFGDLSKMRTAMGGRRNFPKAFKATLLEKFKNRCHICGGKMDGRYLQIDHCVPYEVAGDADGEPRVEDFMLVCGSCNRAKSWSCEHCKNWLELRHQTICHGCYWASPENYKHVAMIDSRRLDLVWTGKQEVSDFDRFRKLARRAETDVPAYIKTIMRSLCKKS